MAGQQLKVMKRIRPLAVGVEAVITRHGTLVGPLMIDLTGLPELTPYARRLVRQRHVPRRAVDEAAQRRPRR